MSMVEKLAEEYNMPMEISFAVGAVSGNRGP